MRRREITDSGELKKKIKCFLHVASDIYKRFFLK